MLPSDFSLKSEEYFNTQTGVSFSLSSIW